MVSNSLDKCFWAVGDPLMMKYHDEEWGLPTHDEHILFEFLVLEGFQAGLSWRTILYKREAFRQAFLGYDPKKVARFTAQDRAKMLGNANLVRNKLKVEAAITNAKRFLEVQQEFGSFDKFIWQFTSYQTLRNPDGITRETIPAQSKESQQMSRELVKRGFTFVGPTICYAYMQTIGMVNDHVDGCFRAPK